eukprot:1941995-Pyramimonas_sp.AAC.2
MFLHRRRNSASRAWKLIWSWPIVTQSWLESKPSTPLQSTPGTALIHLRDLSLTDLSTRLHRCDGLLQRTFPPCETFPQRSIRRPANLNATHDGVDSTHSTQSSSRLSQYKNVMSFKSTNQGAAYGRDTASRGGRGHGGHLPPGYDDVDGDSTEAVRTAFQ